VLSPRRQGTLLVHAERVRGISVIFGFGEKRVRMQAQFARMNEALKEVVEGRASLPTA
jgi:hypothetical protein